MVAADGWLHTGDRGRLTDDGLLEVQGRMDDVIVTGGENVAAREVEDAIRSHPGVTDAAVLGIEDPEWGRAIWAFVAGDVTEEDVIEHCRATPARLQGAQARGRPRRAAAHGVREGRTRAVRVPRP